MRTIKLMADYDCQPLWDVSLGDVGNIDPATLHISDALRQHLHAWALKYDATWDRDVPTQSGFRNADDEVEFQQTGLALAVRLQHELGNAYAVVVKPDCSPQDRRA